MRQLIKRFLPFFLLFTGFAFAQQTQKPYPGVDLPNTWTANNTFIEVSGTPQTVAALGSAAANPYAIKWVSDSTAIATQGQTCVGGGSTEAFAFSNGTAWSCFGTGTGTVNQVIVFSNSVAVSTTANAASVALVWSCWDSGNPANAIYPSNVSLDKSSYAMVFSFSVPQSGFCVISNGGAGGGGSGGSGLSGMSANCLPKAATATTITGCSSITDNAAVVATTEPVSAPSYSTTGINGGITGLEGTGSVVTAAPGIDLLVPSSVGGPNGLHGWAINNNNTGWGQLTSVIGFLDQTGVSTANSGTPQNIVASIPIAGHYRLFFYVDQSAGCSTLGSAALTVQAGWTDGTHVRQDAGHTLPVATATTGTDDYISWVDDFWAAASSAVTITATYTACNSGTWTYDAHAYVERVE